MLERGRLTKKKKKKKSDQCGTKQTCVLAPAEHRRLQGSAWVKTGRRTSHPVEGDCPGSGACESFPVSYKNVIKMKERLHLQSSLVELPHLRSATDTMIVKAVEHMFGTEGGSKDEWRGVVLARAPVMNTWFYITFEKDPSCTFDSPPAEREPGGVVDSLVGEQVEYAKEGGSERTGTVIHQTSVFSEANVATKLTGVKSIRTVVPSTKKVPLTSGSLTISYQLQAGNSSAEASSVFPNPTQWGRDVDLISGDSGNQQKCSLRLPLPPGKIVGEGLASFHLRHPDAALSPSSRNTEHGPMGTGSETEDRRTLRVNAQNI
ncbi:hypothetical protein U0070_023588 [Myodes glareolus]|uniref:Uncharacterized protein n=1 Tax=Myodes glareolus TaxID=447135 RepID=A0AAW0HKJ2_MYOGA